MWKTTIATNGYDISKRIASLIEKNKNTYKSIKLGALRDNTVDYLLFILEQQVKFPHGKRKKTVKI
jgi:hypothetical protein